ncbi:MAG TPA: glycosyltransferase, partial [Dissulfurispiraceae bacterium]
MAELVSILIPAYNAGKWIRQTIESALDQTWPRKEIIIVDDGSSDNTLSVAKRFESGSLKVIHQKNKGASAARNRALTYAQGDYIQWLDADDLLAPDKVSEQMGNGGGGRGSKVLLSASFGMFYACPQKAIFTSNSLWQDLTPLDYFLIKFAENAWLANSTWLVSRSLTELAGPWNEDLSLDDDGEYFCRVVAASEGIRFVEQAKTFYRQSGSSQLSRGCTAKAYASLLLALTLCIRHLR